MTTRDEVIDITVDDQRIAGNRDFMREPWVLTHLRTCTQNNYFPTHADDHRSIVIGQ